MKVCLSCWLTPFVFRTLSSFRSVYLQFIYYSFHSLVSLARRFSLCLYTSVCLSLSICVSLSVSVSLCLCLSICLCLCLSLSVCVCVSLGLYLSVYLSLSVYRPIMRFFPWAHIESIFLSVAFCLSLTFLLFERFLHNPLCLFALSTSASSGQL